MRECSHRLAPPARTPNDCQTILLGRPVFPTRRSWSAMGAKRAGQDGWLRDARRGRRAGAPRRRGGAAAATGVPPCGPAAAPARGPRPVTPVPRPASPGHRCDGTAYGLVSCAVRCTGGGRGRRYSLPVTAVIAICFGAVLGGAAASVWRCVAEPSGCRAVPSVMSGRAAGGVLACRPAGPRRDGRDPGRKAATSSGTIPGGVSSRGVRRVGSETWLNTTTSGPGARRASRRTT